jgi:hypothetical protein
LRKRKPKTPSLNAAKQDQTPNVRGNKHKIASRFFSAPKFFP